jgi:hypothetical protein
MRKAEAPVKIDARTSTVMRRPKVRWRWSWKKDVMLIIDD